MPADIWSLYALMLKSRLFEEAIAKLWRDGLISGEMHLGTGEEAIIAGVVARLREGDALALDHRGTAALLMRGVDPILILRELLGYPDGLCGGRGGHMHLFSPEHLTVSSGIVGAPGPTAVGLALAAQHLRPGTIAVAFFGEGAMNQGMLLESLNLAAVWNVPALFVCKDDGWAITTPSEGVTGGDLLARVRAFGLPAADVDGGDVFAVWEAAGQAIERVRFAQGPAFLRARCVHIEGHFLGFQLLRAVRNPLKEMPSMALPLMRSFLRPEGAVLRERLAGLRQVLVVVLAALRDPRCDAAHDPLRRVRQVLRSDPARLQELEDRIAREIDDALALALAEEPS
ncbi:MAG: thiamine pyrophosphate-dependent dehydrogenase E1 component subunit alpha [Chloroflexi bacterium]|nr:thiamine pyrophosphate-dependent dehydrogenase E1 component subunit alpha [Chloroflexota bacterium]